MWGINDFDEATDIPYPFDLVRLTTSTFLVPGSKLRTDDVSKAILDGYRAGLMGPRPTLLGEQKTTLGDLVAALHDHPGKFWHEVDQYKTATPPSEVADGLRSRLPPGSTLLRFAKARKGGGSLGRPRYMAIAHWHGGHVLREAKALVPSAWDWAHDSITGYSRFLDLARGSFRAPDPFLDVHDRFIFRRIAADSHKLDLSDDPTISMELLNAMGFDIGAIHAADRRAGDVREHFGGLDKGWLRKAAEAAKDALEKDFTEWKSKGE